MQTLVTAWQNVLLDLHTSDLIHQCGLEEFKKALDERSSGDSPSKPLSQYANTDSKSLSKSIATFTRFLSTIDIQHSPRLDRLVASSAVHAHARNKDGDHSGINIHQRALQQLSSVYRDVYEAVMDLENGYEFPKTLMSTSPDEVGVLLGVTPVV